MEKQPQSGKNKDINMTPTQAIYGEVIRSIDVTKMTPQDIKKTSEFLAGFPSTGAKAQK